jgi:hypothetical protein
MAGREEQRRCATSTAEAAEIHSPGSREDDDDVAELLLASTAGQELVDVDVPRQAHLFPLASEAGQEKVSPAASALQQEEDRRTFIEGSSVLLLPFPLRPPEKKKKPEEP